MKRNIILDTDMYNEIDDQFALVYLLKSIDNFNLEAITIAPFFKSGYAICNTIEEGIEKSYNTTLKILEMLNFDYKNVYKGSTDYLANGYNENNAAVNEIIKIAHKNDNTTIVAIGAITNVALALKKDPSIIDKVEVIWLGGNSFLSKNNNEFNFRQDIKAVQEVFNSKVKLTVIPCRNVASNLTTTIYELEHYLKQDKEINKYLIKIFKDCKRRFLVTPEDEIGSSKTLWDLSALAYIINEEWFTKEEISCPEVLDDGKYLQTNDKHKVTFVTDVFRNKIYNDFFKKMR